MSGSVKSTRISAAIGWAICFLAPGLAASQPVEIATQVAFTDGPTVDRQANLYFTDIINQRIMKLSAEGERPGVAVHGTPRVPRTDLAPGAVEVLADSYDGKPLIGQAASASARDLSPARELFRRTVSAQSYM
jgi:sugar lactone lactonase YvrE